MNPFRMRFVQQSLGPCKIAVLPNVPPFRIREVQIRHLDHPEYLLTAAHFAHGVETVVERIVERDGAILLVLCLEHRSELDEGADPRE